MFLENSQQSNYETYIAIATLISTSLIVYFTARTVYYKKKQTKETSPMVALLGYTFFIKNIRYFEIIIANSKPHNIVLKNIKYKKLSRYRLNFLKKYETTEWTFPEKSKSKKDTWLSNTNVTTIIKDEQKFVFDIPNFDHAAKYKIFVETSVGNCKVDFPKILDSTREKSYKSVSGDSQVKSKYQQKLNK